MPVVKFAVSLPPKVYWSLCELARKYYHSNRSMALSDAAALLVKAYAQEPPAAVRKSVSETQQKKEGNHGSHSNAVS